MKKLLLCCFISLLLHVKGYAQTFYLCKEVKISFFSEARFEDIEAHSRKGSSVINIATGELAFKVPIQSFEFDNSLMQEHFNENYLESDQHPYASFAGSLKELPDLSRPGSYPVRAIGQLQIRGISKTRSISGMLIIKNNKLVLQADFLVPVSDHQIDIPKDKLSNISQNIAVKLEGVYEPKE